MVLQELSALPVKAAVPGELHRQMSGAKITVLKNNPLCSAEKKIVVCTNKSYIFVP